MPNRTMDQTLDALGEAAIDELAEIISAGHGRYMAYDSAVLLELDVRAQAACTFCHMHAEADRRLIGRDGVQPIDYRGWPQALAL
jgi:hypothetical protein